MTRRPGITLIEMIIMLVVGAAALAVAYRLILAQQTSYRHLGSVIGTQQTNRLALAALAGELREVSASGGDLIMARPESLTVRVYRKLGIICQTDVPGQRLWIWDLNPGNPIAKDDSVAVFSDGVDPSSSDDEWLFRHVSGATDGGCDRDWPGGIRRELRFSSNLRLDDLRAGSPLRAFERMTFGLFRVDGEWVLARRNETDGILVPLLGPLAPPEERGLRFRYYGSNETVLDPVTQLLRDSVTAIEVGVRAKTPGGDDGDGFYADSLATRVYLRNN